MKYLTRCRKLIRNCRTRRGAMLPLIAFLLPVLLIFVGFAVDLAYMQSTRLELRAASDAAARAGTTELARTENIASARQVAIDVAAANEVAGSALLLSPSDVLVGRSEPNASGRWIFTEGATPPNSVRVNGRRDADSLSGSIPLFFGRLVGVENFEPVLDATGSFLNVDICLVLDRSTSMKEYDNSGGGGGMYTNDPRFCSAPYSGTRWVALDSAVRVFTQALRNTEAEEHVALVTYSSDLSYYNPPLCGSYNKPSKLDKRLGRNLNRIDNAMDDYLNGVWNGNTYIEAGMRTGITALTDKKRARAFADKIMIVLTDGNQNEGSAMSAAHDCADEGIIVHTITFSNQANQNLMRNVANTAGGRHYHAPNGAALEVIFRDLAAQIARLTE